MLKILIVLLMMKMYDPINTLECFGIVWLETTMIMWDFQFWFTYGSLWRRLYEKNWFTSRLYQNQTVPLLGSVKYQTPFKWNLYESKLAHLGELFQFARPHQFTEWAMNGLEIKYKHNFLVPGWYWMKHLNLNQPKHCNFKTSLWNSKKW